MRIALLISGRGSNARAIAHAFRDRRQHGEVVAVLSNEPQALGLRWANQAGFQVVVVPHRDYSSRERHDEAVRAELSRRAVDLVCLAGYMRVITEPLLAAYPARILNVHPSLLPAFPGRDAQAQALERGVQVTGATIHLVDREVDHGPILSQEAVPVLPGDNVTTLSHRILEVEHRLYPATIASYIRRNCCL